jgi:hypothetical protein
LLSAPARPCEIIHRFAVAIIIVDESTCGTVTAPPDKLIVLVVKLVPSHPIGLRVVASATISIVGGYGARSGGSPTDGYSRGEGIVGSDKPIALIG